jgi:hypothetical protein
MSDFGYCLAYRKAWTHPIFKDLREAAIWNFLYQNAFWEEGVRNFNGHLFELKRGQIVVTPRFLAKGFGMTEKGARLVMQKLEKHKMLSIKGTNKGSIVTICNYDIFQDIKKTKGEQEDDQRENRGRTKGANKNTYNTINTDNTIIGDASPPKTPKGDFVLPDWIHQQDWKDFEEVRRKIKKPMTDRARAAIVAKLEKMMNEGKDPREVLENSIRNGWQDVYEPKSKGNNYGKQSKTDIIAEQHARVMEKYRDRGA